MLVRVKKDFMDYKYAIILFALYYITIKWIFGGFCPSVIVTGLPCPACGITRAFLYALQGDIQRSLFVNPTLILWLILIAYFAFFRYVKGMRAPYTNMLAIIVIIVVIAIYAYRMYSYFPERVPMTYNRGNILEQCIPGYGEFFIKYKNM